MLRLAKSLLGTGLSTLALVGVLNSTAWSQGQTQNPFGAAGIEIDADHVLRLRSVDPRLRAEQLAASRSGRGEISTSPLRKVSLNRLQAAAAATVDNGDALSQEMISLAGITRLQYVMYLPGSGDIVLAGPAEEVTTDADGYHVGLISGRPTLRLDDVVIALRAYAPGTRGTEQIGCSIDPTQEGLARMQQYLAQFNGQLPAGPAAVTGPRIAMGLKESLGLQTVRVLGVPTTSRFAQTLVEADYRMKLIGIGLERPPVRLTSWVARANPNASSARQLQRWYFVPDYEAVAASPDGHVLKLSGQGVKLVGEDERVDNQGNRSKTAGHADGASVAFTKDFTKQFDALADRVPVFHAMRNLVDLSVAAAYIHKQDMYAAAGWDLGSWKNDETFDVRSDAGPEQVETAVNAVWQKGRLMTPIGGGVLIRTSHVIDASNLAQDAALEAAAEAAAPSDLAAGQWWWD